MYAVLTLSGINIAMLLNFFSLSLLPLFSGTPRTWQSGAKLGFWGRRLQPPTDFAVFTKKTLISAHFFIVKGRTLPAVSAVSNRQYKNILVGLPKSLGMSKSRSLAKINEMRMQL